MHFTVEIVAPDVNAESIGVLSLIVVLFWVYFPINAVHKIPQLLVVLMIAIPLVTANVNNGAKTRWSNFYHGIFMLVFLILDLQFSDLIPFSALAAVDWCGYQIG